MLLCFKIEQSEVKHERIIVGWTIYLSVVNFTKYRTLNKVAYSFKYFQYFIQFKVDQLDSTQLY